MEGLVQIPAKPARKAPVPWAGYTAAVVLTGAASLIHSLPFAPFQVGSGTGVRHPVSAAILAIAGGMLARNLGVLPARAVEGAKPVARTVIPITIVLTGAGLDLGRMAGVGAPSLIIVVLCIVVAMFSTLWFGKLLRVWTNTALLIGAGTAICGTSAIVAVAPILQAADEDVMLSIGTVNLLGLALMFALPAAGNLLHLRDDAFGVWAGTTIHAVPQVVAAGFAYSASAGALATLVKLVRVTLLAPFLFVVGLANARKTENAPSIHYARLVPPFVWGFLALALLNTFGLLPVLKFRFGTASLSTLLADLAELLLTVSMAAMGMEVNIRLFARVGGRALLTGLGAAMVLCVVSLALIRFLL